MARSLWKGSPLVGQLYDVSYISKFSECRVLLGNQDVDFIPKIQKLYRRNTLVTDSLLNNKHSLDSFYIYNGYDFLLRTVSNESLGLNLSGLVSCIELNVKHKAKISKHARKMQQAKTNKKKLTPTKVGRGGAAFQKKKVLSRFRNKRIHVTS